MTEGIIQNVFRKYYSGGFQVDIDDVDVMVIPASTLEDFAKELIKEIAAHIVYIREVNNDRWQKRDVYDLIKFIIGETKE